MMYCYTFVKYLFVKSHNALKQLIQNLHPIASYGKKWGQASFNRAEVWTPPKLKANKTYYQSQTNLSLVIVFCLQ